MSQAHEARGGSSEDPQSVALPAFNAWSTSAACLQGSAGDETWLVSMVLCGMGLCQHTAEPSQSSIKNVVVGIRLPILPIKYSINSPSSPSIPVLAVRSFTLNGSDICFD